MSELEVHKFGGSSLADAERMAEAVARIEEARAVAEVVVVASAIGGATDALHRVAAAAEAGDRDDALSQVDRLVSRHEALLQALDPEDPDHTGRALQALGGALQDLVRGVVLTAELTPRTRDHIVSTGEKLSARLLATALRRRGLAARALDADTFLETDDAFGRATPLGPVADRTIIAALQPVLAQGAIPVVTGYCGRAPDGATTTLGRGGSDLTATLVAAALGAREVVLWSDVDGVFSADPRVVPEARPLAQLNYREAAEMSFYGAKVLHQRTMIPVVQAGIPVRSRNTRHPEAPGTVVDGQFTPGSHPVKAVTAVRGHSLISIEGKGMAGVPGIAARVFQCLASEAISVTMISQSSSEASICLGLPDAQAAAAERALKRAFRAELARGDVEEVGVEPDVGLVAVVGLGMAQTPGVSGRVFAALGRERINVLAIAQGTTELNITFAVAGHHVELALRTLHQEFGLHRLDTGVEQPGGVDVILLGCGQIGRALLELLQQRRSHFAEQFGGPARVVGIADRRGFVLDPQGLTPEVLAQVVQHKTAGGALVNASGGRPGTSLDLVREALAYRLARPVLVDVTDDDQGAAAMAEALSAGADVVTANKKPLAGPLADYRDLRARAEETGRLLRAEATVGAGLPVMDTLEMLLAAGDRLVAAEGCFSGTLNFVLSRLDDGALFSEAVAEARREGYTEPDPVQDLAGEDMARKAVILGRLSGLAASDAPLALEGLVDREWAGLDWETLRERLAGLDEAFAARVDAARDRGEVLRFVARVEAGRIEVGLRAVAASHPLGQLRGTDNMIVLHTARYSPQPLVISGPGAGVAVTAMGVLGDLLRIAATRS